MSAETYLAVTGFDVSDFNYLHHWQDRGISKLEPAGLVSVNAYFIKTTARKTNCGTVLNIGL